MATAFSNNNDSEPRQTSRSARIAQLLNAPASRKTPMGTDTAWALKLKEAVDTAARQLRVQVISAKPSNDVPHDDADMVFELDTDKGRVLATRQRNGAFVFAWM